MSKSSKAKKAQTVLVLQGGGALGAYQAGVHQVLAEHNFAIDWVVGTSIGAINGAIIAGNLPQHRNAKLAEFWQQVAREDSPLLFGANPFTAWWWWPWASAGRTLETLTRGIPGFFVPRAGGIWDIDRRVATHEASFYDTAPLRETLERVVDFEYLNSGAVRCTVCAVKVASGELVVFDNRKQRLTPAHIMASGALPPGFPPVLIDGVAYWDAGIYSNTPADIVLDDAERRDTLCFMVDLWDPTEAEPASISQAMARQKDIQYASRSREHLDDHRRMQNMRRAIQILSSHLPAKDRNDPALRRLSELGCEATVNIVRLIMKALPGDDLNKDIDFARETLAARWRAGARDAARALHHRAWIKPLPPHLGMAVHELAQEERRSASAKMHA